MTNEPSPITIRFRAERCPRKLMSVLCELMGFMMPQKRTTCDQEHDLKKKLAIPGMR